MQEECPAEANPMSGAETQTKMTPDDLLALPDGKGFELVDGQLVEKPMGWIASRIAVRIAHLIELLCEKERLGWVFESECGYRCFPDDPNKVRKPDVSFIRADRLPDEHDPDGWLQVPPDLAVEVISPRDLVSDTNRKVQEYLDAGVRLVWVVDPGTRTAVVHRADGSVAKLRETDELDGEDVLPGFRHRVGEICNVATQVP